MPKRPRTNTQREPSTSQRSNPALTQENDICSVSKGDFVKRFVRYMLIKSSSNAIITETDIRRNVLNKPGAPRLKNIMNQSKRILNENYGFKLQRSFNTKTQYYFLQSVIDDAECEGEDEEEFSVPDDSNRILLMLVLLHVFMSENNCSEESLLQFMEKFQSHIFGNFSDFLKNAIKQKYLDIVTENNKVKCRWGPKAECTLSKKEMLDFMVELYDRPIQKWPKSLKAAEDQKKSLDEDYNMDVSDESD